MLDIQTMPKQSSFTVDEVAEMLNISRTAIYRLLEQDPDEGGLRSIKIGGSRRILYPHLEEYLGKAEAEVMVDRFTADDEEDDE